MVDESSPIFVFMGGEGTAKGVNCDLPDAVEHGAICVQVEHRFYGESLPRKEDGGGSNENLRKGLSIEYNLQDTQKIVEEVQAKFGGSRRPVVNFGGSYSGATATWFRMAMPETTDGAVSSSGVVNPIYKFTEFDGVISDVLDKECERRLRRLQKIVDHRMKRSPSAVKKLFNATNLIDTKNGDADFMYMLADGYSMMVQYGSKKDLCKGLARVPDSVDDSTAMRNLANVLTSHYGSDFPQDCYYDSECLKIENNEAHVPGLMGSQNARSWRWQKCSQVAFLQSRPKGRSALRSPVLTLEALESQCRYVFGALPARDDDGNKQLRDKWGADHPEARGASNVMSLSFSDDPWKAATVQETNAVSLPYCYTECEGCGHCGAGVTPDEMKECAEVQSAFVKQVLDQARFAGSYSDPNHPGCGRKVDVIVSGNEDSILVSGSDKDEDSNLVPWGPLQAKVDGLKIVVDFSPKGGPPDLTGSWDPVSNGIVWADGNEWPKL